MVTVGLGEVTQMAKEANKQTLRVLHADSPQKSGPEPPFAILFLAI